MAKIIRIASCHRFTERNVPFADKHARNLQTNPLASLNSSISSPNAHKMQTSQFALKSTADNCFNLGPFTKKEIRMRQSYLYNPHKLSNQQISDRHQLKHEMRHQLTQSLNLDKVCKHEIDLAGSQPASTIKQMINQDSSIVGLH